MPRWALALSAVALAMLFAAFSVIAMWAGAPLAALLWGIAVIICATIAPYAALRAIDGDAPARPVPGGNQGGAQGDAARR